MVLKSSLYTLLLFVLCVGCGKSDDSSDDEEADEATQLALADASAFESVSLADEALSTLDEALEETAGALVIELTEDATYGSKWCSENGDPMADASDKFTSLVEDEYPASEDGGMNSKHPNYAARRFHCQLKVNSESPDTIRGAYSMVKGILCAAENANAIDWDNPGSKDVSIKFSDACFGDKMVEEMADSGDITVTVTTALLDDDENWDKSISLTNITMDGETDEDGLYYFAFRNSKEGIAVRQYAIDSEKTDTYDGWSFSLDADGELRFEHKTYNQPDSALLNSDDASYGSNFVRLYAKGVMKIETDEDGATSSSFESVEAFEGIYSTLYPNPDNTEKDSAEVLTIKGTSEAGFETKIYACNSDGDQIDDDYACEASDPSTFVDLSAEKDSDGKAKQTCFPSDKECDDISPITFGSGDAKVIMAVDSVDDLSASPWDWIKNMEQPLEFSGVTMDYIQK